MVVRHPFLHETIHPWAAMMTHEAGMLIEEAMALLCPEDLPCLPDLLWVEQLLLRPQDEFK
jgi:hypothetical protein